MAYDVRWANLRTQYRIKVTKVLSDIRNGSVQEDDLDRLHNFCVTALALMAKVQEPVWRKAQRDAEIAGLLHEVIDRPVYKEGNEDGNNLDGREKADERTSNQNTMGSEQAVEPVKNSGCQDDG